MAYFADSILYYCAHLRYNNHTKEVHAMTVKQRMLALKILQMQENRPEYAQRIGIRVSMVVKDPKKSEEKDV